MMSETSCTGDTLMSPSIVMYSITSGSMMLICMLICCLVICLFLMFVDMNVKNSTALSVSYWRECREEPLGRVAGGGAALAVEPQWRANSRPVFGGLTGIVRGKP